MHYNILSELKNATRAKKDKITFPFSKMDFAILTKLVENGYVKSAEKEAVGKKNVIVVRLAYKSKEAALNDFKIMSKPSRHLYTDYRSVPTVKQGHGLAMLSTSQGIMTGREAKKNKIGGEYLFEIW
ncbi:MAG TPA: 30S ribosomal protein S8 [Candidatus Paceibacterota bacterium]|nr:30S ribosomal protein S8 [Candidatus Paceibacterota bacterium]